MSAAKAKTKPASKSASPRKPAAKKPLARFETLFRERGFHDFKWIDGKKIAVGHWVRMKCLFGCKGFAKRACCPPNVPPIDECRAFIGEYSKVAVFHFQKAVASAEQRHVWSREVNSKLLALERELFLSGSYKAFLLPMDACGICAKCAGTRDRCRDPLSARPGPDALGIDVYATARSLGYPIEVLSELTQAMNRYAFLLVE